MQALDHAAGLLDIRKRLPLGDLEDELVEADCRIAEDRLDVLHRLDRVELLMEEVDRDLEMTPVGKSRLKISADQPEQRERHLAPDARGFDDADERGGLKDGVVRLSPAHQHLASREPAAADIDDRLVVGDEFAAAQGVPDLTERAAGAAKGEEDQPEKQGSHHRAADVDIGEEGPVLIEEGGQRRNNAHGDGVALRAFLGRDDFTLRRGRRRVAACRYRADQGAIDEGQTAESGRPEIGGQEGRRAALRQARPR